MKLTHYPPWVHATRWLRATMYTDPIANHVFDLTPPGKKALVRRNSTTMVESKGV